MGAAPKNALRRMRAAEAGNCSKTAEFNAQAAAIVLFSSRSWILSVKYFLSEFWTQTSEFADVLSPASLGLRYVSAGLLQRHGHIPQLRRQIPRLILISRLGLRRLLHRAWRALQQKFPGLLWLKGLELDWVCDLNSTKIIRPRCNQNMTAVFFGKKSGQEVGPISVVKNEKPVAVLFQPAFDGGNQHVLAGVLLLRQVQEPADFGKPCFDRFQRIGHRPKDSAIVIALAIGIFHRHLCLAHSAVTVNRLVARCLEIKA